MREDVMEAKELEPKEEKILDTEEEENVKKDITEKEQTDIDKKNISAKETKQEDNTKYEKVNEQSKEQKDINHKENIMKKEPEENIDKEEKTDKKENADKKQDIDKKETKKLKKEENNKESTENEKKKHKIRNNNENKTGSKPTKRIKKIIVSIILVAIIALAFSTVFALTNINNEKIISGVTIKGIEVSGLTKEEAIAKMETTYAQKKENNIMLQYQDFESELNPTLMEINYDIANAVDEAYSIGRNGNIFSNNYHILGTLIGKRDIDVNMTMNEESTKQTINDIGANLPGIMVESSYSVEEDKLIITRGKEGIVVDTDTLLVEVKNMLNDIHETENVIEIPVETKIPQEIDIDKIHSEIYQEAKDAYYTKDPFTVYPEVEGIDFDVEQAKAMIAEEVKDEYVIDLIITKPNVTIDQIGTEAFPDQLATFTTRYNAGDRDRTTNLVLACQKINGKVLMPGEIFSYNETLGPRTYSAGYRDAKVYESGQVVDGIGGGICQISSTLYNAALMSDMKIIERRNHQFVTSYVGAGRDATVVYGSTDFRFKNTRTYPIRIVAFAKSGVATVSIFGIKEADREYTYSFSTKTISTIPYTTKYVEDSSLAPGKEVVKQKGANGLVTQTYMTKMLNGKVVSTELLSKDTYSAMQKIIRRGVTKTTSNPSSSGSKTNTTTNNDTTEQQPQQPQQPQKPETPKEPEEVEDTETTTTSTETTE